MALPWVAAAPTASSTPAPRDYKFGFDRTSRLAWRQPDGGGKEYNLGQLIPPASGKPTDAMTAQWCDGATWAIACYTLGEHEALAAASSAHSSGTLKLYFDSQHSTSHNRIIVKKREDRSLLMSIYEQGRQVLQCTVKRFASEDDAGFFMAEIAEKYCKALIARSDLKILRNRTQPKIVKLPRIKKKPSGNAVHQDEPRQEHTQEHTDEPHTNKKGGGKGKYVNASTQMSRTKAPQEHTDEPDTNEYSAERTSSEHTTTAQKFKRKRVKAPTT